MVYLPFIVVVAQRYKRRTPASARSLSLMIPYTVILLVLWTLFFVALVPARHPLRARATRSISEVSDVAFDPVPSVAVASGVRVAVAGAVPATATAVGIPVVATRARSPSWLGLDRDALAAAGFDGARRPDARAAAAPTGRSSSRSASATSRRSTRRRCATPAAAFARAAGRHRDLAALVFDIPGVGLRRGRPGDRRGRAARALRATTRCGARRPHAARRRSPCVAVEDADALAAGAERGRVAGRGRQPRARPRQHPPQPPQRDPAWRGGRAARRLARVRGRAVRQGRARRARLRWPAGRQPGQRRAAVDDQADATRRPAPRVT